MNSNKKTITICSIIALVILAIVVVVTLISDLTGFSIVFGAFFVVLTICLAIYLREEPDEFNAFIKNKKKILRTYDSVIIEVEDIPNIAGKNIIKVKSIEDLVDAQLELREPIYYKNDNDSCFFILLHYNEACIFVLRMNDSVVSPTEQSIRYMKEEKKDKTKEQENILENLEKTVVYKLDELRSFRISPIRNSEKINVVDDAAIKKNIEEAKEQEITSSVLSSEISKTMYLKDLRERMLKYEEEQSKTKEISTHDDTLDEASPEMEKLQSILKKHNTSDENVELSPIDRLRQMVKEQEQEITKELNISDAKEITENEEIVEEVSLNDEKDTISRDREEKELELKVVESTAKTRIVEDEAEEKVVPMKVEDDDVLEETTEDEMMTGVVVLSSLEEEPITESSVEIVEEVNDEVQEFVPVKITDEDEELVKEEKVEFTAVTISDTELDEEEGEVESSDTLSDEKYDESESSEVQLLRSIVLGHNEDEPIEEEEEEEISQTEIVEDVQEDEENNEIVEIESPDEVQESEEIRENEDEEENADEVEEKVTSKTSKSKGTSKPRRSTKPRKVTHSARRAQKHVSSRAKR